MSEAPVQVIVAAFSNPDRAGEIMDELKQGKRAGLVGIVDAAAIVKDADGKLKVTNARGRSRRVKGFVTGGAIGGLLGILAGPVGWAALGGSVIGTLTGQLGNVPIKHTLEDIGKSLTLNSSAIVAIVEHTWMAQVTDMLALGGAVVAQEALTADIARQLQAGGNVLYTAGVGDLGAGAARVAENADGSRVSGVLSGNSGVYIGDAQFTDEQLADEQPADATEAKPAS